MRVFKSLIIVILIVVLVGCNEEIIPPEVKRNEPVIFKNDFEFTKYSGALEELVPGNEVLLVGGELVKNRYETNIGEFGVEVHRVYRGDAAKYRLPKEDRERKLKKDEEWVMVELDVYNFELGEEELGFSKGEIGLYTKKGKKIRDAGVNLDSSPENIVVYEGEEKRIKVVSIVKKKTKTLLLGVDKIEEEFRLEDLDENGNLIEREEEVEFEEVDKEEEEEEQEDVKEDKEKDKKEEGKEEKEGEESTVKYISLEEIPVIDVFYEDEEEEQEDVDKKQKDLDKEDKIEE